MEIKILNKIPGIDREIKLNKVFGQFNNVLNELKKKELPNEVIISINNTTERLNPDSLPEKEIRKQIRKAQSGILKLVEKELKFVAKVHYRNTWLALGMGVFGISFGVALSASLGNMGLLGIGLPIGLAIGIAIGTGMDKKAFEEGRQLNLELTHY